MLNKYTENRSIWDVALALSVDKLSITSGATFLYKQDGKINFATTKSFALTWETVEAWFTATFLLYINSNTDTVSVVKSTEQTNWTSFSIWNFDINEEKSLLGIVIVKNATASQFVGWTTELDAVDVTTTIIESKDFIGV